MRNKINDLFIEILAAIIFVVFKDQIMAIADGLFGSAIRGMLGVSRKEEGK